MTDSDSLMREKDASSQENVKKWFVAVVYRQERLIKRFLDKIGMEAIVPVRVVIKQVGKHRYPVEQLAVPGYVFVRAEEHKARNIVYKYCLNMRFMQNADTHRLVSIPDKQMEDFLTLVALDPEQTKIISSPIKEGQKVRVIKGDFAGVEGELIRIAGHKRVVVRLDAFLAVATTYIPREFLEPLT